MTSTVNTPAQLSAGFYWYMTAGKSPVVVEKRDEEPFVRFPNGAHQRWAHASDRFVGPLVPPSADAPGDTSSPTVSVNLPYVPTAVQVELRARCRDLLHWQNKGQLQDGSFTAYAQQHFGERHDAYEMAERATVREALMAVGADPVPSPTNAGDAA